LPGHLRDKKYQRILWLNKLEKDGNQ